MKAPTRREFVNITPEVENSVHIRKRHYEQAFIRKSLSAVAAGIIEAGDKFDESRRK